MSRPARGLLLTLLITALAGARLIGAEPVYVEQDDWFGTLSERGVCTLNTSGYDRAGKTRNPALSVTLRQRDDGEQQIELTATAVTTLTRDNLAGLRPTLHVTGPKPVTLPAMPAAITETRYDRRLTLRPLFPHGSADAGLDGLITALRVGERLVVEINGRPLEPAFSLRGFDALWQQASQWCGPARNDP